ncbi:unnamed protein product [Schistocephalus solidus]|uniref:Cell envelope biogenesis protein TolA n=1 Tax=Schistocephalus solidus TaxID=70667 RepID=A0A0X3Q1G0_SCHSO|nr:unnamed protein product [Schistocephalus solidus]
MEKVRGPSQYNQFAQKPATTNAQYGYLIQQEIEQKKLIQKAKNLGCAEESKNSQEIVYCKPVQKSAEVVTTGRRVDYFIAPKLKSGYNKPYLPQCNQRKP